MNGIDIIATTWASCHPQVHKSTESKPMFNDFHSTKPWFSMTWNVGTAYWYIKILVIALYEVMSHECSYTHIFTLSIIDISGYVLLSWRSCFDCCNSDLGDI